MIFYKSKRIARERYAHIFVLACVNVHVYIQQVYSVMTKKWFWCCQVQSKEVHVLSKNTCRVVNKISRVQKLNILNTIPRGRNGREDTGTRRRKRTKADVWCSYRSQGANSVGILTLQLTAIPSRSDNWPYTSEELFNAKTWFILKFFIVILTIFSL